MNHLVALSLTSLSSPQKVRIERILMKGPFDPNTKQTFENGKILALTFEGKTIFGKTSLTKFV